MVNRHHNKTKGTSIASSDDKNSTVRAVAEVLKRRQYKLDLITVRVVKLCLQSAPKPPDATESVDRCVLLHPWVNIHDRSIRVFLLRAFTSGAVWPWRLTFQTAKWHTGYSWSGKVYINLFLCFFRVSQYGTDRRTGKMRNAAYRTAAY